MKFSDLTSKQQKTIKAGLIGIAFILVGLSGIAHDIITRDFHWIPVTSFISYVGLTQIISYRNRHGLMEEWPFSLK